MISDLEMLRAAHAIAVLNNTGRVDLPKVLWALDILNRHWKQRWALAVIDRIHIKEAFEECIRLEAVRQNIQDGDLTASISHRLNKSV